VGKKTNFLILIQLVGLC